MLVLHRGRNNTILWKGTKLSGNVRWWGIETAMMFLGEENTNNEDPVEVIIEGTSGDGFEQEILADYKSQDYEFIPDMTTREVASPNDDMDWLFIDEGEASM